jgi:hypothetical protein
VALAARVRSPTQVRKKTPAIRSDVTMMAADDAHPLYRSFLYRSFGMTGLHAGWRNMSDAPLWFHAGAKRDVSETQSLSPVRLIFERAESNPQPATVGTVAWPNATVEAACMA